MHNGRSTGVAILQQLVLAALLAVSTAAVAQTPQKCDVNGDGLINQTDINAIIAARNLPASGPSDPRDPDNNGVINALDVRTCQLRCTLAACALPPSNTAPVANGDAYTVQEDSTLIVGAPGVLGNDTDAQNNALTAAVVSGPASGTLVLSTNGSFSYMPAPNFSGTVTFTYRAHDGALNSNTATVTISVAAVNDGPVGVPDSYSTAEDTALSVVAPGVLANDSDVDNPALTAQLVSGPAAGSGSLTLNPNGSFTFTPAANFTGAATFTYRSFDGLLQSGVTLVTINVAPQNDAPVANPDAYSTDEDTVLNVAAPGVRSNDTDAEGDTLSAILVAPPAAGVLVLNPNGSFSYTPAINFSGQATFSYRVSDGFLQSNPAIVTLTVLPINDAPVAAADNFSTPFNTPLVVVGPGVLANDTDQEGNGLTALLGAGPASGSLSLLANGGFTYTPNTGFSGGDSFTYRANDGIANSNLATVTIAVNAASNTAPTAGNDSYSTAEDTQLVVAVPGVLGNDSDAQNDPLTAAVLAGPAHGALTLNANGSLTYTPSANFNGPDSFTYRANDGALNSNIATVSINVTPVNDAPNATNDSYNTNIGTPLTVAAPGVLGNDNDVEGNALTAVLVSQPASGTLNLQGNGAFTFTPVNGFTGPVTFTYQAFDGLSSNIATVTITVVNNLPSVSIVATIPAANEAGPVNGLFTVTRTGGNLATPLNVTVAITGTATNNGVDYANISTNVNIPANQASAAVPVNVVKDNLVEGAETVVLTIQPSGTYAIGTAAATVTIADDPPVVAIVATNASASEAGPANGLFTVTRSGGNLAAALNVTLAIAGTATNNGVDYAQISTNVNIPAGQASATVPVTVVQDNLVEGNETVILTIQSSATYSIGTPSATVTIADSPALVSIAASIPAASEVGPVNGQFTVTRIGGNIGAALNVTVAITGTATNNGVDYAQISTNINIPAGQASATVPVNVVVDNVVETAETVILTIQPSGTYSIGTPSATVTIADSAAVVSIVATTPNASEVGPANGVFTVTRNGGNLAAALNVTVAITGTATNNGVDYAQISTNVNIPANQTTATVAVAVVQDNLVEGTETVILTIQSSATYSVGTPSATVAIADSPALVSIAASIPAASEVGPVNGQFTVTRSGGNIGAALNVTVAITGTATNNGVDYAQISTNINIPAGQASATVPVNVVRDNLVEGSETVILTVQTSGTYNVGAAAATVTIADDPAIVSITATIANASETGPVNGQFTVTRTGGNLPAALNVTVAITGTATNNGVDYANISTNVNIPAGQASVVVPVNVVADGLVEVNETVILTIQPSGTYNVGTAAATVTITDGVAPGADVRILKSVNNASPSVGSQVTFTMEAFNIGPADATGVVVQDLLPAGYTFVSKVAGAGTTYNEATGVWNVGGLTINQAKTLAVTATVLGTGPYVNTATRSASAPTDPNAANDSASATVTPTVAADVQVTKVVTNNPTPTIGQNVTFRIQASNQGPGTASGVVVQDLLPSGYAFVSKTVFQGSYVEATGVWTVGTIANGSTATLDVTATALGSGSHTNTATRTASTPTDGNAANDTASITVTPFSAAEVGITKTVTNNPTPTIGQNVTFRVQASNQGPGTASGVVVQDLLPSGYAYVSKTVFQGTYVEATGVWTVGTIANGSTATLDVTATALPSGSYTNTATKTASSPTDPNAANNTASITVTPTVAADVSITKTITNNPTPTIGQNVTFRIQATNLGPGTASGVVVQDLLPSGYAYVSKTVYQGSYVEATGVWTVGTIANGSTATLDVTATALGSGSYTNTATRTASTPTDGNAANDTASVTATPFSAADVGITKTVTNNPTPTIGQNVTFRVQATNAGPGVAQGVVVQDLLPSGYAYVSKTVYQGSYVEATGVWTVGQISSGSTATLDVTATALPSGSYTNTATKTASSPTDPNAANNTASITVTPTVAADVSITKTITNNPTPTIGQNVTFRIQATNLGPGTASGVVVQDLLPSGYAYVSKTVYQGSYVEATGVWTVGTITNGGTATLDVTATALASGSYTNTATRTASTPTDGNAANDTASITATPFSAADVGITKTITNNPTPTIGQNVTFRVQATNAGPGVAQGVVVQDLLPSGYAYVSKTVYQGTYVEATGVWTVGQISSGSTATLDVTATALSTGSYTNTATKTASSPNDPNAANNTASITATPFSAADVGITKTITNNPTPTIGQNVTFRVQATNAGPGVAQGVVVQDLLPSGYAYVSKTVYQGSYVEATGVWTVGGIAAGGTATLDVTATALASGSYTNTATKTASTPTDPNAANNTASITATPFSAADVAITKTITNNPTPTIGQNVTFRVQATNAGPGVAQGVVVQDLLPSGYAYVSKTVYQGSYVEATGVWTVGQISSGSTATLDVTATALGSGSYTNTATRTASTPTDGNAANDTASVTATPFSAADVGITKTVTNNPTPTIGQNVTFRVQATNAGPGVAQGVVVQDLLPSGYAYVSKTVYQGSYVEATGVWTVGQISSGSTATLDVTATALSTGSYTNTATKTASSPNDPNAANNTASVTATPFSAADVAITNVVQSNPTPLIGTNVVFRIQATNLGPGTAAGVVVQDLLPSGYAYVSKTVYQGSYVEATGVWTVGVIGAGSTSTLDITATALATGSYSNTATRTASNPTDPNAANNSVTIVVPPH